MAVFSTYIMICLNMHHLYFLALNDPEAIQPHTKQKEVVGNSSGQGKYTTPN